MVLVDSTPEVVTFEIVNDGAYDLKRFYTPEYFERCGLHDYVEIYVQRHEGGLRASSVDTSTGNVSNTVTSDQDSANHNWRSVEESEGHNTKKQVGGYFQNIQDLTIPYRYFAYVLDNNHVSEYVDKPTEPKNESSSFWGNTDWQLFKFPELPKSPDITVRVPAAVTPLSLQPTDVKNPSPITIPDSLSMNHPVQVKEDVSDVSNVSNVVSDKHPEISDMVTDENSSDVSDDVTDELSSEVSDVVTEQVPIFSSNDEQPKPEIIILKIRLLSSAPLQGVGPELRPLETAMEAHGWLSEVADKDGYPDNIELTSDGLVYDDLEQIMELVDQIEQPPFYQENLYKINHRWIAIVDHESKMGTSIAALDTSCADYTMLEKRKKYPVKAASAVQSSVSNFLGNLF